MTAREVVLPGAILCFASFIWGMAWHFKRPPVPTRGMLRTGLLAAICLIIQTASLLTRDIRLTIPAMALYMGSLAIFWSAVLVSRRKLAACGQPNAPSALLNAGPYRYVRHPFYLAYNLSWFGGFVATDWWVNGMAALLMAVVYEESARQEERAFLSSDLALAYRQYQRRAGKYLPRFARQ